MQDTSRATRLGNRQNDWWTMKQRIISERKVPSLPTDHPYMNGAWRPNLQEVVATQLEVIGQIPKDLEGVYLRNTENPVYGSIGKYHPFDGDGMVHMVRFHSGKAEYRNRFVATKGLQAEEKAGRALWAGLAGNPKRSEKPTLNGNKAGAQGSLKDSSSTDVIVHRGEVLTTFYQCGDVYRMSPTLEPLGTAAWAPDAGVSAHCKVDLRTQQLMFFNYSKQAPYLHYGVVDKTGSLVHYVPVPVPGPRLPHDMCVTSNYSILNDFPLFWDPDLLKSGVHATRFYKHLPSRFALVPRLGSEIRWFEASPTFVLHFVNAYEEDGVVVMDGFHQANPMPDSDMTVMNSRTDLPKGHERMMVYLDMHAFQPRLWRWEFDLRTGKCREKCLHDRPLEFGTFNRLYSGKKYRFAYSTTSKPGWFLFTGVVKHDLNTGESWDFPFGPERYGSEPAFAPRMNAKSEDDGYVVTLITDMRADASECLVIDAQKFALGEGAVVARIMLPHRLCSGTHSYWAPSASWPSDSLTDILPHL